MAQQRSMPWAGSPRSWRGFTLVELLVAVAILAILASIVWPSFSDAIRRGRRSEAFTALSQVQLAQARWRTNNIAYSSDLAALQVPSTTAGGHYLLELTSAGRRAFTARAVAQGTQALDLHCQQLLLTQDGGNTVYASTDAVGHEDKTNTRRCWNR